MSEISHQHYLLQALALAEQGRGFCAPNPAVGALIVRDGQVIGQGFHQAAGFPHAEIEAFTNLAGQSGQGATLYVTLEPCCHWGKTPPCTDAIIQAGIQQVYFGFQDPNPIVAGKGAAILKAAGIICEAISLPEITEFYQNYQYWQRTGRPWVTAKLALSLDGKVAGEGGLRVTITGEVSNRFTQQQRKRSDAILTTLRTVIADDPLMNARLPEKTYSKKIYVLDSQLQLPETAKIVQTAQALTVFHAGNPPGSLRSPTPFVKVGELTDSPLLSAVANIVYHSVPANADGRLDWQAILEKIGQDGIHDLWVEAGPTCFYSLLNSGFLNKAYLYVAPKVLGEKALAAFTQPQELFSTAQRIDWRSSGRDALCSVEF